MKNYQKISICFLVVVSVSCGAKMAPDDEGNTQQTLDNTIKNNDFFNKLITIANKYKIDYNLLTISSFSQSYFSIHTNKALKLNKSSRNTIYSLYNGEIIGNNVLDFWGNTDLFAKILLENSLKIEIKNNFDKISIMVNSILNAANDSEIKEIEKKILFNELIYIWNNGFSATNIEGTDIINYLPLNKDVINSEILKSNNKIYTLNSPDNQDNILSTTGNYNGVFNERAHNVIPKILLKYCGASSIACFEHLKNTYETPSHFMLFPSALGGFNTIQFHRIIDDLKWYDKNLENTIIITIAGKFSGITPNNYRHDWLNYEDYVSIANMIKYIIYPYQKLYNFQKEFKYSDILLEELVHKPSFPEIINDKQINFSLPVFWEHDVFTEILNNNNIQPISQIKIPNETKIKMVNNNSLLNFKINVNSSVLNLSVDIDSKNIINWRNIRYKTEISKEDKEYLLTENIISKGYSEQNIRILKITSYDENNKINGLDFVRFKIK